MLRKVFAVACFALFIAGSSQANAAAAFARVVTTCGEISPEDHPGDIAEITMDITGTLCTVGGSGGSSFTVNYGSSIGTKGTPSGFEDGSGNFQPLIGSSTNGQYVEAKVGSHMESLLQSPVPCKAGATSTTQSGVLSGTTTAVQCDLNGNPYVNAALGNNPVGTASFTPAQVSVGATATSIASARTGAVGTGRVSITITNTTTTAIFLGPTSGVTTSTGTLLPGIVGASVTINTTSAVWGIVATGTATVTEFETF